MDKRIGVAIAAAMLLIAGTAAFIIYGDDKDNDRQSSEGDGLVKDALGRSIQIPDNLDRGIITIGSTGPLRFASMFDVFDDIIEVDKGDITDSKNGRAYSYAYAYDSLDVDTQSHPDNALDSATEEKIGKKNPSLIITNETVWNGYSENFGILSKRCPVVVLKDQDMKTMGTVAGGLDDYMEFNIQLLGKVLKKEDRAEKLIDGIESVMKDIDSLSGSSSERVYVAGVTISGSNTLNTTFPTYIPFTLNGITNAYNLGSNENKVVLTVEDFTKLKIDSMVIDPSSSDKINTPDSQYVMKYIHGINSDGDKENDIRMFVTLPIVWDSINYDSALASAYITEHLVYGTLSETETAEKVTDVFTLFYGDHWKDVLSDMMEFFKDKSSANGQEMPIMGEVVIAENGGTYSFRAA